MSRRPGPVRKPGRSRFERRDRAGGPHDWRAPPGPGGGRAIRGPSALVPGTQEGELRRMNIVVCVKYVPDATADRQFESDNTVDRVGVDGLLSELDEYAVEQALQIREKAGDETTVTVLTVGPEKALD